MRVTVKLQKSSYCIEGFIIFRIYVMKIVYLLAILILFFSCKEENKYVVEDTLYQCIINEFNSRDIDFVVEINRLEKYLIEENSLELSLANDYLKLNKLLELRTNESLNKLRIETYKFNKLATFFQNRISKDFCLDGIDPIIIQHSRFYTLLLPVNKELPTLDLNVLDCQHKYYRVKILLAVLMVNLMSFSS